MITFLKIFGLGVNAITFVRFLSLATLMTIWIITLMCAVNTLTISFISTLCPDGMTYSTC